MKLVRNLAMTALICTFVIACDEAPEPQHPEAIATVSPIAEATGILDHYRSLGQHHSGTSTDKATSH